MKLILRGYGSGMTTLERQNARTSASETVRTRGTGKAPKPPRDVFTQPGPRGVLLNWRLGAGFSQDVTGYRIYKDDESKLFATVADPKTTQYFIETTAGATPPPTNFFVSSVNAMGVESPLVATRSSAIVEAGAPAMPVTPPTYTKPDTGGNPRSKFEQP